MLEKVCRHKKIIYFFLATLIQKHRYQLSHLFFYEKFLSYSIISIFHEFHKKNIFALLDRKENFIIAKSKRKIGLAE